jgi:hypothetical protein
MKTKTQLGDLDLEVLNPIETKKIIGGNWYDYINIGEVVIHWDGGSGGNDGGGWGYDPTHGGGDYPGDWGGGSGGGSNTSSADGILETPSAQELWWLVVNTTGEQKGLMRQNANVALMYGQNQADNVYDALRHAMWSALDAADLGLDKAKEFHTLHETANPGPDNAMDLHNNQWGFNWYSQNGDPGTNMQQFLNDFWNAVNSGTSQYGNIKTHP